MIILLLLAAIYLLIGVIIYIMDQLTYGRIWPDVDPFVYHSYMAYINY